jgi:cardiolipin synthase
MHLRHDKVQRRTHWPAHACLAEWRRRAQASVTTSTEWSPMMPHWLPNLITLLRIALIPAFAYFLVREDYALALPVFSVSAATDFADGYIARRFQLTSRVGTVLDPVADKLNMLIAALVLAWQALLPLWLAIAVIARDVVIVVGALVYRMAIGRLDVAPSRLSKLNTLVEFTVLLLVMATGAGWLQAGRWLRLGFWIVGATAVASGLHYVYVWGSNAVAAQRSR